MAIDPNEPRTTRPDERGGETDEPRSGDGREADADKHPDDHAVGPGGT